MSSKPRSSDKSKKSDSSSSREKSRSDRHRPSASSSDSNRDKNRSSKSSSDKASSSKMRQNQTLAAGSSDMIDQKVIPMTRPGFGKAGNSIRLETNFFPLKLSKSLVVSQYSISILLFKYPPRDKNKAGASSSTSQPNEKAWIDCGHTNAIEFNRNVFNLFVRKHGREFGCKLAYDGRSIAYAPHEVNRSCLGVIYKLKVDREGNPPSNSTLDGFEEECRVKIEHARYLKFDELVRTNSTNIKSTEYLAALDVALANPAKARDYIQVGRSFYSPDGAEKLGRSNITAKAWYGFYQSARLSQMGLAINLDESYTAFWDKGGERLSALVQAAHGRPLSCRDDIRVLRSVASTLKVLKVRADHSGIVYKLHGFKPANPFEVEFHCESMGRKVTIAEYFHSQYNITLRDKNSPLVKTHPKKDTYMPMELLRVVKKQRLTGLLSPEQTQSIVKVASNPPARRRGNALNTMTQLNHNSDPVCRDFGITVDRNPIKVNARVLPTPTIEYSNNNKAKPSGGSWRANGKCNKAGILDAWVVVVDARMRRPEVETFVKEFVIAANRLGVIVKNRTPELFFARRERVMEEVRRGVLYLTDNEKRFDKASPRFMVVIRERQDASAYNQIKRAGDLQYGIATQVLLAKNITNKRGLGMTMDNIMLKVNIKLGGQNSIVAPYGRSNSRIPDVPFLNTPHIILGADVTHPMGGGKNASVAALVGSRDRAGVQYSASLRNQSARQEVISDLGGMFEEVYGMWRANFGNAVHARSIIMFRDGVSEGQFEEVMQKEVLALRYACRKISPKPLITYIIVTKRHHARFFPQDQKTADRSGNVLPGTVVDQGITSKEYFDFYLNSHAGIKGTSKPSKYTVLVDENRLSPDALQGYIFRLSHSFVRCNRSVSMVNSAYYAHLLAFRGRAYLGDDESDTASSASGELNVPKTVTIRDHLKNSLYFV